MGSIGVPHFGVLIIRILLFREFRVLGLGFRVYRVEGLGVSLGLRVEGFRVYRVPETRLWSTILSYFFLKGTIMKYKCILFSPWLLKSPGKGDSKKDLGV